MHAEEEGNSNSFVRTSFMDELVENEVTVSVESSHYELRDVLVEHFRIQRAPRLVLWARTAPACRRARHEWDERA
eukprot:5920520-Pleurochrysis_carterae.AAC.1